MTYAQKLRDPRWQKKRLEILQRDGFACRYCSSKDKELHVHHSVYPKGKQPWEAEDATLFSLCNECHEDVEQLRDDCSFLMCLHPHANLCFYYLNKAFKRNLSTEDADALMSVVGFLAHNTNKLQPLWSLLRIERGDPVDDEEECEQPGEQPVNKVLVD